MSLSNETYNHLAETVTKLAIEIIEGKIFGLGAGGYSPDVTTRNG